MLGLVALPHVHLRAIVQQAFAAVLQALDGDAGPPLPDNLGLQHQAHLIYITDLLQRQLRDHDTLFGDDPHKPLLLQLAQRFPDRGAAGADLLHQLGLVQEIPGGVAAGDDVLLNNIVCLALETYHSYLSLSPDNMG